MKRIPYYWVNPKNNRAFWKGNKLMASRGFGCVALGDAGPETERRAMELTERYRAYRKEDALALGARRIQQDGDTLQFVYFLHVGDRIKIGTSRKPWRRLQTIAGSMPGRVKRLIVVAGTKRDEKRLHDRFVAYRDNGEWFVASKPLILTIGRCAMAGQIVHDGDDPGTDAAPRVETTGGSRVESRIGT